MRGTTQKLHTWLQPSITVTYARTALVCAIARHGHVERVGPAVEVDGGPGRSSRACRSSSGTRATLRAPTITSTYGARARMLDEPWSCVTQPPAPILSSGRARFSCFSRPSVWNSFSEAFSRTAQVFTKTKSASPASATASCPSA